MWIPVSFYLSNWQFSTVGKILLTRLNRVGPDLLNSWCWPTDVSHLFAVGDGLRVSPSVFLLHMRIPVLKYLTVLTENQKVRTQSLCVVPFTYTIFNKVGVMERKLLDIYWTKQLIIKAAWKGQSGIRINTVQYYMEHGKFLVVSKKFPASVQGTPTKKHTTLQLRYAYTFSALICSFKLQFLNTF